MPGELDAVKLIVGWLSSKPKPNPNDWRGWTYGDAKHWVANDGDSVQNEAANIASFMGKPDFDLNRMYDDDFGQGAVTYAQIQNKLRRGGFGSSNVVQPESTSSFFNAVKPLGGIFKTATPTVDNYLPKKAGFDFKAFFGIALIVGLITMGVKFFSGKKRRGRFFVMLPLLLSLSLNAQRVSNNALKQLPSDWNAVSGVTAIKNKPAIVRPADTALMLSGYAKFGHVVKYVDTFSMLTNRVKISDTSMMFLGYAKTGRSVQYSDTATMLNDYQRKVNAYGGALYDSRYNSAGSYYTREETGGTINVRMVAAQGNSVLSGSSYMDGPRAQTGDLVLLTQQSNPADNGLWVANTSGAWTRSSYTPADLQANVLYIVGADGFGNGTNVYKQCYFRLVTKGSITWGVTPVYFEMLPLYGYHLSNGIVKASGARLINAVAGTDYATPATVVKYTDTAAMLSNRLKISDTATMLSGYGKSGQVVKYADTATLLSNRLKISDTTTMLSGYQRIGTGGGGSGVQYSDTSAMLSGYAKDGHVVKYADTAAMLSNRLRISDTAIMLSGYGKSGQVVKYADTATMLSGYGKSGQVVKYADTATLLSNRLKISDTTTMLSGYQRIGAGGGGGSFAPVYGTKKVNAQCTSGTITLTAGGDSIAYYVVGRMVTVFGNITVASVSSPTLSMWIDSLPFRVSMLPSSYQYHHSGFALYTDGWSSQVVAYGSVPPGSFGIQLRRSVTGSGSVANDLADFVQAGTSIFFSFSYLTDDIL